MKRVAAGAIVALLWALPVAAETASELWEQGYRITWKSSYESIEECTPDNAVVLSDEIVFICDSYEYVYHYGEVFIASKTFTYQGRSFTSSYLCMEGEDECLEGKVIRQ